MVGDRRVAYYREMLLHIVVFDPVAFFLLLLLRHSRGLSAAPDAPETIYYSWIRLGVLGAFDVFESSY